MKISIFKYTCLNSDLTPLDCRYLIGRVGLQSCMSVSVHACQSPMKHFEAFDGSQIRHIGLLWVFETNNIFVNSPHLGIIF